MCELGGPFLITVPWGRVALGALPALIGELAEALWVQGKVPWLTCAQGPRDHSRTWAGDVLRDVLPHGGGSGSFIP